MEESPAALSSAPSLLQLDDRHALKENCDYRRNYESQMIETLEEYIRFENVFKWLEDQ